MPGRRFATLSEAADHYYQARSRAQQLLEEYNSVKQLLTQEIKKREAAVRAIESDQARFDNPDRLKRLGDLILANLATATVEGSRATVVDYYDERQPTIQIELPENKTLQQAAVDYFSRYQKARRALTAIGARRQQVAKQLDPLRELAALSIKTRRPFKSPRLATAGSIARPRFEQKRQRRPAVRRSNSASRVAGSSQAMGLKFW